jgi:hypothetical protein
MFARGEFAAAGQLESLYAQLLDNSSLRNFSTRRLKEKVANGLIRLGSCIQTRGVFRGQLVGV